MALTPDLCSRTFAHSAPWDGVAPIALKEGLVAALEDFTDLLPYILSPAIAVIVVNTGKRSSRDFLDGFASMQARAETAIQRTRH